MSATLLVALGTSFGGLAVAQNEPVTSSADAGPETAELLDARTLREGDRASRDRDRDAAAAPAAPAPGPPPAPRFARPSDGVLTSAYGSRWGRLHAGIDFAAGAGSPVRSAAAGTVAAVGPLSGYGTTVRVHHADGAETLYAHLGATEVQPGQAMAVGQPLGREGNSGRSTGPHLHFEVRVGGDPVDPARWLTDRGITV